VRAGEGGEDGFVDEEEGDYDLEDAGGLELASGCQFFVEGEDCF
jgi:hypothetical protein